MLNLIVKMSREPINKERWLHICSTSQLHGDPVIVLVCVYVHWEMTHLSHPCKPVTFKEPHKEIPPEAGPESTKERRKCQMKHDIEKHH